MFCIVNPMLRVYRKCSIIFTEANVMYIAIFIMQNGLIFLECFKVIILCKTGHLL